MRWHKSIDAVTVSTPDHMHAPAALMAMRLGKHCFCQKPLTRTIYEARLMGQVAREMKVATQMGNQGTAESGLRRQAALLRAGVRGQRSREVHLWTNRPIWPQGITRPAPSPCPQHLKWDLWLGVAPPRPYAEDSPSKGMDKKALQELRRLSSLQVARLVGFRQRRPGRHGLPYRQHALHGTRPAESDFGRGRDLRHE